MDLISKTVIKNLLKKYKIYPSRRLGQNFLIKGAVFKKIIEAAELTSKDIVLEIGPGIGNLTQEISNRAGKVIAVEKDKKMCEILKETLKDFKNIKIIQADILKLNFQFSIFPDSLNRESSTFSRDNFQFSKKYKVVANLPYYITSPVIRMFLESEKQPALIVLMVQKEVAERICAQSPKMNLLAVSVQFYGKPEIVSLVSKKSFWPSPKVDSAILKISQIGTNLPQIDINLFFRIVKVGFSHPRKQLINNLLALPNFSLKNLGGVASNSLNGVKLDKERVKSWLMKNKIKPSQRAETLNIKDWINLTKTFLLFTAF